MRALPIALALVMLTAVGCGTTKIFTNDDSARIYVNGNYMGQGAVEIRKRGTPSSATVRVQAPDGRRAEKRIKRRFTATTFVIGVYTYFIGMFTAWEYPDAVYLPLEEKQRASGWDDDPAQDAWMSPPPGWTPPAPPPEQPAPPPAPPAP